MKRIIIAIDGPAASGKSTTAKLVAERLQYLHIDTGAMYRAMALKILQRKIDSTNFSQIEELAHTTSVRLRLRDDRRTVDVVLDGDVVSSEIRSQQVSNIVSNVSSVPAVRSLMVKEQREMGKGGGIVLEGRDIGTVVFPDAELKIFMVANEVARAERRLKELAEKNINVSVDSMIAELRERDRIDSQRVHSPLRKAEDAVELDTTNLSIEEQAQIIVLKAQEIIERA